MIYITHLFQIGIVDIVESLHICIALLLQCTVKMIYSTLYLLSECYGVLPVERVAVILELEAIVLVVPEVFSMHSSIKHHL